jgi:type II secretory ATPase GspE/PulE/Tfp pilus assembly ATPase PilB-like protein
MVTQGSQEAVLHATAIDDGMIPLRHHGWSKVIAGITTVEEVVRVTAADLEMVDE